MLDTAETKAAPAGAGARPRHRLALVAIGFSILAGAMFVVAVVTDRAMGNSSGTSRRILAEQETLKQLTRMSTSLERAATSAYFSIRRATTWPGVTTPTT